MTKKCYYCKKKLKLIKYECKCNQNFCSNCRLPETHKCTFDFLKEGKEKLTVKLEKVVNTKVTKI